MDKQNDQEFDQSSNQSKLPNTELTNVIALEEPGDSDIYDEHIDRLKLDIPLGELFNWTNVMEVCSVAKAQAYNILNYGQGRGVIVKARRGKFYWTE
jgi:hypothetical protein